MDRGRTVRRGVALGVAAGLAGALLAGPVAAAAEPPPAALEWGECPEGAATGPAAAQLRCATVPVPVDYDDPDGPTIEVMVSRLASQKPDERRGVLMLNPGGPGGAGLSMPADLVSLGIPSSVLDSYDLIGMDPRGVGHSSPVSCGFTTDQEYGANIPPYAVDEAAVARQAEVAKGVADQCAAADESGTLRHMSTANTARDMDRIRAALGEEKINYFGASYGSALGAAYASMFPERTDRVVLDSNVGDTTLDSEGMRRFGLGAEQRFPDFAKFAATRHAAYDLGRTPEEVRRNYFATAERLDREPVADITGVTFRLMVFVHLYSDQQFPALAQLWQSVNASDEAAVRRQLADGPPSPNDNAFSAFLAVTCNDVDWPEDVGTYQENVAADRKRHPLFGAAAANITPCAYWPHEPAEPPVEIDDDGPSNVLILQNLRDPATPREGGRLLREAFGDRARMVSVDQGGHGVYVFDDNPCALNVTTTYLVEGERPDDMFCAASKESGLELDSAAERLRDRTLERLRG